MKQYVIILTYYHLKFLRSKIKCLIIFLMGTFNWKSRRQLDFI